MATTAPGLIQRKPGSRTFGETWYRTASIVMTMIDEDGPLGDLPSRDRGVPDADAFADRLGDRTGRDELNATMTPSKIMKIVTRSCTGRSFQNGRPSSTS